MSWGDNSFKNWQNVPNSNPEPDLHNSNAHYKFGENPLIYLLKLSTRKENIDVVRADN